MTTLQFRPAVRTARKAMLGVAGPSGGGKTLSALKLARGLCLGVDEQIFGIDTEADRMLDYACAEGEQPDADHFRFQHYSMAPPFAPANYQEAIFAAIQAKAGCIIVDSMSHEHEGEGGLLEWHERELTRMAGKDYDKRERVKFTAWIEPKQAHNKLVNKILQCRCHFIFCFRAKDKIAPVKNAKGKTEFVSVGWTPICSDRFEYEMGALLILPPSARGVPELSAERTKLQAQHAHIFPAGKPLDEDAGRAMARWCAGKPTAAASPSTGRREKPPPPAPARGPAGEGAAHGEQTPQDTLGAAGPGPGPEYHADMVALHRELRAGLEGTNEPENWWRNHPKGLGSLKESAPRLHEDLRRLAASKKHGTLV
jgi:hypothetical protein